MRQLELALDQERRGTTGVSLNQATIKKLETGMAMMMVAVLWATKGGDGDSTSTRPWILLAHASGLKQLGHKKNP